jgi:hypothetical protein
MAATARRSNSVRALELLASAALDQMGPNLPYRGSVVDHPLPHRSLALDAIQGK